MAETSETYRYLVMTPGVCGGKMRVDGTRICVHDVIGLLQNGETVDSVTRELPPLTRAQVEKRVADSMWEPEYLPFRAATPARMEEMLSP